MNPAQKQFSLNRAASRKQFPVSSCQSTGTNDSTACISTLMKTTPCPVLGTIRAGGTAPAALMMLIWLSGLLDTGGWAARLQDDGYHVFPGENIQDAMQAAARNPSNKIVKVHAGEYRPTSKRQALIWFNKQHDGIHLEALGEVTLTAANPEISTPASPGYPAAVNHVVYFGNGISSNTMIRGFRLTGANRFVTEKLTRQIEPDTTVPKNLFFFTDPSLPAACIHHCS